MDLDLKNCGSDMGILQTDHEKGRKEYGGLNVKNNVLVAKSERFS